MHSVPRTVRLNQLLANLMSLIMRSKDEAGIESQARPGARGRGEPYAMSGSPLVLEDGQWLDWLPPEGQPLRRLFLDLRTDWLGPR